MRSIECDCRSVCLSVCHRDNSEVVDRIGWNFLDRQPLETRIAETTVLRSTRGVSLKCFLDLRDKPENESAIYCNYNARQLAAQCIVIGPVCMFVCLWRAGGVRTLLQPARAQCLRLSERFFIECCIRCSATVSTAIIIILCVFIQLIPRKKYHEKAQQIVNTNSKWLALLL